MNPNGTHDKALLEEIERLLNQRKQKQLDGINTPESGTSHPILDELTSLLPQASPEFEEALEARLLARYQPKTPITTKDLTDLEEHRPMTTDNYLRTYQPDTAHAQRNRRSRRLPLTLAAAVIAVLFSVALLLTLSAQPEDETPVYSALLTATTASPNALNADDCPPVEGWTDTYTVRSGDTFAFIAARYGIDFDNLYQMFEANCIPEDPNYVPNVGDVLRVPDAVIPKATATFTITPTIASGQLDATRILAEATQRALDGTPTPTISSGQLEATRIIVEATQRGVTANLTPTLEAGLQTATQVINDATESARNENLSADFTQQAVINACNTEATQAAQCSESGIAQTVEAAVQATLSAMGQFAGGNATIDSLQTVAVRDGAGTDFSAFEALEPGTSVDIRGQSADGAWYEILLADGRRGWVPSELVSFNRLPVLPIFVASPTATITASATFTPTTTWTITASATFTPTTTPTPTPFATFTPTPAGESVTQIVVARRNIRRGEVITENDITEGIMLTSQVVEYAVESMDDVVGMIARADIYIGQTIESWALVDDPDDLLQGVVVPEGRNSILIPFDTMLSVSYGVQQGDHVALEVVQDGSTVETFEDAIILGVLSDPDRLVVAVLPTDATTYFDLIDSGADFQISINQISIRSGMQSVSIPIDQIGSASLWIVEGDVVVIISDDGLTTVSPSATVLRKTQEYLYVEVTPLEATRLTRIIEAGSPLTFALLSEDLAEIVTQIVVATQIIGRGEVITEEDVALRGWSSNAVPENAITSIEDVVGMRARTDIFTQQPILTSMVIEDFTPSMSDLDIPAGKRAVAMPFNTDSMSYSVQEGDYVSIGIVPNDSTDVVVENALILAVNEDIVYVAVSPTEAVVLASLVTSGTDLYLYLIPITESSGETRQIVVSVQNIQRGEIIQEEDVALRNWQPNAIPENAITSTESVIGMRARTDVFVEQPILTSMVLPTTPVASANGTCCANIPLDQISDASMWIMENDVITIRIGADVLTTSATVVLVTQDFISVDVTTSIYTLIERRVEEGSVFTAFLTNTEDETNTETRQIVVALRDIERGARIVRADLEMADVPIDLIPEGAYTDFESVIGHRARVDFDAGAPISEALLVPTLNEDFEYEFEFADNAEIIEIPMRQVYMPGTGEFRNVIIESELPNGTIITVSHHAYVGYGATEVEPEEVYGIIVPTEDADLLQGFVNSGFPIRMYGFSVESDDTEIAGIIPTGLRAIAIPMPAVLMDDPLQVVGSRVDVLAAMYFVDVDGEFQSIVPGQENVVQGGLNAAWNLGQQATLENGETPELVIQRTILNALVVQYQAVEITGEDGWVEPNENAQTPIVTLAVSPQDAVILNYLIDANIPLAFIRSGG